MKKFERNELSFLFLWVINPIIIVFYQNCSMTENSFASAHADQPQAIETNFILEPNCLHEGKSCLRFE